VAVGAFVVRALFALSLKGDSMTSEKMKIRGADAAVAYLERCGMAILDRDYKTKNGVIPIIAMEKNDIVRVDVNVGTAEGSSEFVALASTVKRHHKQMDEYMISTLPESQMLGVRARFDAIGIRVLAEDKALLRHHRAAY
jgi:Holliday junction resolvase-like predicted endonuclease